jgi:hypothetical protein
VPRVAEHDDLGQIGETGIALLYDEGVVAVHSVEYSIYAWSVAGRSRAGGAGNSPGDSRLRRKPVFAAVPDGV